jgi:hypothetical protein
MTKVLSEAIAQTPPKRKRRKTLHGKIVEAVATLTEVDWERYDNASRLRAIDDCAQDVVKIFRAHQRRAAAAKKGHHHV